MEEEETEEEEKKKKTQKKHRISESTDIFPFGLTLSVSGEGAHIIAHRDIYVHLDVRVHILHIYICASPTFAMALDTSNAKLWCVTGALCQVRVHIYASTTKNETAV
ncbi:hypothetical protein Pelo_6467 [Pelomyxa schiedti]|nr:hypothetical protein Pelo_6467 [Pelomyxa schiedti]